MLRFLAPMLLASVALAQDRYSAALEGDQEVPPVVTTGRGWSVVSLDTATNNVRIFVHYEGLTGPPIAAHLHLGAVGVNGPIIVGLAPSGPNSMTGSGVLTPAQVAALGSGGTYVNVHTAANPGGEIRGQVVTSASTRFTAVLSGAQVVPPVATAATATAVAYLHEPENRIVYKVVVTGVVNPLAAHFHQAPPGTNGPIIFDFGISFAVINWSGVTDRLTAAQLAAWKANGVYVDVHTTANPAGEIRGQMLMDAGDHFVASLDGSQAVPPTASAGLGRANLILSPSGTLNLTGGFGGLTGPFVANVHLGAPGVNGPIVFPIMTPSPSLSATFTPSPADLVNLRAGNWYVNIHPMASPGEEIRGQFQPASLPTTFGEGCVGGNGVRPQIGATGFLSLGWRGLLLGLSAMSVDLYGAQGFPGAAFFPAFFLFGQSRDTAGGLPLPIELTALGLASPGCYLLVDPVNMIFAPGVFGSARVLIDVPFSPALSGSVHYAQWVVLDPTANPSGFTTSSAITLRMQ